LRYLRCVSLTVASVLRARGVICEKDFASGPHGACLCRPHVGGLGAPVQPRQQRSTPLTAKRTTRSPRAKSTTPATRKAPVKKAVAAKSAKQLPSEPSKKLLDLVLKTLDADKAEDIVSIELASKTPMADYMVIASGRSNRHVAAIAEHLSEELKKQGIKGRAEGLPAGDWVLVDAMDVIIHVFRPEVRAFYNLEKMWGDGAAIAEAG
jgi:ribosome-associated protein